jgi:acetyl-CoA C-acetyltransferase
MGKREAVIVATARTPIGRAYRGAFNNTHAAQLAGHAIREAVGRAGVSVDEVEDVIMGCAMQQGCTSYNIGRIAALAAGLPVTVGGMSVDRQCSSGLYAIATAAKQIIDDGVPIAVGGGVESISLVQNEHMNKYRYEDEDLLTLQPDMYISMLETAEVVAKRYGISREIQDGYALQSQQRTALAQAAGLFAGEIVPITVN